MSSGFSAFISLRVPVTSRVAGLFELTIRIPSFLPDQSGRNIFIAEMLKYGWKIKETDKG